ncbi:bifunctional UDP-N-acetylglucosamine diphosphorylase/glucosamine-1-phosphate N-acetyltransferase GlmU [Marinicauda algicola]|uniref:Bifunctional protein GlmU n=1 Tax=Marinicauda algicola TaxID=2029849 RepID=A0A4S2H2P4_9PROT|nr:bifunctional UDP-N-acetylglucosamine diphosphorylase/glucosamine-1-phosphate N-acetyltransferase GlmU [Marinicauda algicola]TGY89608.1 bifunctional UDP-N-acetylglucosamine diphosphorylase/glucosamine-1-phosphate N-acetyltransferase GlmU [Marinicauda algicola]
MTKSRAAIILAAGQGTRMKSALAKPLHAVGGRAMLDWTLSLAGGAGVSETVVVWGALSPAVRERAEAAGARTALQDPPQGTGHAVACAKEALAGFEGLAVVLYADTPLIRAETIESVFAALEAGASVAVLGFEADDPTGYGRLVEAGGQLERIVEHKEANEAERAIRLVNSGVLAAPAGLLFDLLSQVTNENAKGEYYLTDIVAIARSRGLSCTVVRGEEGEMLGVNSRADLAAAEAAFQQRMRAHALAGGVTLTAPETVFFSYDTQIASDVTVEPHVVFGPGVSVASGAVIHAFSHLEGARVGPDVSVGPYARLRPGAVLEQGARVGNFVEVKKARLGAGAKANHLTYLGDAEIGAGANIGAGTITCNYDGFFKHTTVIGEGAFIGSNAALVAPVTIGKGAMTASGSVITQDVPDDALALARARQETKPGWAARFRKMMQAKKDKNR